MTPEQKSGLVKGLIALIVIAAAVVIYLLVAPEKKNPVEVLDEVASIAIRVPATNPLENKIPELNPVEKFNPFKYENPLR